MAMTHGSYTLGNANPSDTSVLTDIINHYFECFSQVNESHSYLGWFKNVKKHVEMLCYSWHGFVPYERALLPHRYNHNTLVHTTGENLLGFLKIIIKSLLQRFIKNLTSSGLQWYARNVDICGRLIVQVHTIKRFIEKIGLFQPVSVEGH